MHKVNSIYLIFLFFFFSCSDQNVNTDSAVEVKSATYKVASIFPTSLPLLGENSRKFVENVNRASDGKWVARNSFDTSGGVTFVLSGGSF